MLAKDEVQPIQDIFNELRSRSSASIVPRTIDPNKNYTIESVYENELQHRKQQVIADLKREDVFIDTQIDGKVETYYKGNDTYTNLLRSQLMEIDGLLPDLKAHLTYVQLKYKPNGVELIGEKQVAIKRDGIMTKEKQLKCPIFVDANILESPKGKGYGILMQELKDNELAFHDPITLEKREQEAKKADEFVAEHLEDIQQDEDVEQNSESEVNQIIPQRSPQIIDEDIEQNEDDMVTDTILDDLTTQDNETKSHVETESETQSEPALDSTSESEPQVDNNDDNSLQELLSFISQKNNELFKTSNTSSKGQEVSDAIKSENAKDDDTASFGWLFGNNEDILPTPPQKEVVQDAVQPSPAHNEQSLLSNVKAQVEQLLMTEHVMKLYNFKRAAEEVEDRIIDAYGGDKARASLDVDYQKLKGFVDNKIAEQQQNVVPEQQKVDWSLPKNKPIMDQDYQKKRDTFSKKYNEDLFGEIQGRAQNTK